MSSLSQRNDAPQLSEEVRQDSFGHSPDDRVLQAICIHQPLLPGNFKPNHMVDIRLSQVLEGYPAGLCNFGIGQQARALREIEHERAYRDGWEDGSAGYHVIQLSGQVAGREIDSELFGSFPD